MTIIQIIFFIVIVFLGFTSGRIGHIFGGEMAWTPHHWIPGLILVFLGLFFYSYFWGAIAFPFGIGLLISDFRDFLGFKTFEPEEDRPKKFWHID